MVKRLDNGATEGVIIQIILYCRHIDEFSTLLSTLSQLYVVTITTRWETFLRVINHTNYDLLLVEMPEQENDLLTFINSRKHGPDFNVILLNGSPTTEFLAHAFRCGVIDYFPAPIDQQLLCERVRYFVGRTSESG